MNEQESIIASNITEFSHDVHQNAVEHGWWEEERGTPECLMLMVSELSEALEEYRDGKPDAYCHMLGSRNPGNPNCQRDTCEGLDCLDKTFFKPEGIGIELADCIIRIFDYCAAHDIDIGRAIMIKHLYNKTRPYRHGGKKA